MNFLKKNGPYLISGLVLIALLLLFLPYLRGGYENQYYASGFYTIFNIKKSGLKPIASNGTPSALLIIAFIIIFCLYNSTTIFFGIIIGPTFIIFTISTFSLQIFKKIEKEQ